MRGSNFKEKTVAAVACLLCVVFLMLPFMATYTSYSSPDSPDPGYYTGGDDSLYSYLQMVNKILHIYHEYDDVENYDWGPYGRRVFAFSLVSAALFLASYVLYGIALVSLMRQLKKFWLWLRITCILALSGTMFFLIARHFRKLRIYEHDRYVIVKALPYLYIACIVCFLVLGFTFLSKKIFKESPSALHCPRYPLTYLAIAVAITVVMFVIEFNSQHVLLLRAVPSDMRRTYLTFAGNIRQLMPPLWNNPKPMITRFGGVIPYIFFCARLAVIVPLVDLVHLKKEKSENTDPK